MEQSEDPSSVDLDGQIFASCRSPQVSLAVIAFYKNNPCRFWSYDPIAQIDPEFKLPCDIVVNWAMRPQADLGSSFISSHMRRGADIYHNPNPDRHNPQWAWNEEPDRMSGRECS